MLTDNNFYTYGWSLEGPKLSLIRDNSGLFTSRGILTLYRAPVPLQRVQLFFITLPVRPVPLQAGQASTFPVPRQLEHVDFITPPRCPLPRHCVQVTLFATRITPFQSDGFRMGYYGEDRLVN